MTISDADFKRWARHGASEVTVLAEIEFAYQTASGPATSLIYLSSRSYADGAIPYKASISKAPELQRAIDLAKLGGQAARTVGDLTLDNGNGDLDFLLDAIIDGRDVSIYVGDRSWARGDFRLVMVGSVVSVSADNDQQITVKMRDKNYLLDRTIIGDAIASGPNVGKPKPIVIGNVKNFDATPYMLDSANLIYYINNFALNASFPLSSAGFLADVRDAGVSLLSNALFSFSSATMTANAATDTLTYTSHGLAVDDVVIFRAIGVSSLFPGLLPNTQYWVPASGLTANDFQLSLTKGGAPVDITGTTMSGSFVVDRRRFYIDTAAATIQLSGSPAGRVTMDMQGIDAAGVLASNTAHQVMKFVLQTYTPLASTDYDGSTLDTLAANEITSGVYFGIAILDRMNVLDLLSLIALSSYSWFGWNASGVLTAGLLDLSHVDNALPIDSLGTADAVGDLACANQPLPHGRVIFDSDKNVVVQGDGLANTVTAANRSLWAQVYQLRVTTTDPGGTDYPGNWWDYHATAIDSPPIESGFVSPSGGSTNAQAACDAITALFKPWTRTAVLTVPLDKYALNPGDCVSLTYPRYGLSSGKNFRVASVKTRVSDKVVDLVLVRQSTPDYTSTSHFAS